MYFQVAKVSKELTAVGLAEFIYSLKITFGRNYGDIELMHLDGRRQDGRIFSRFLLEGMMIYVDISIVIANGTTEVQCECTHGTFGVTDLKVKDLSIDKRIEDVIKDALYDAIA